MEFEDFLGLTSYYRRFVHNYAKIAHPLNQLLKKNAVFKWNDKCQLAFETLSSRVSLLHLYWRILNFTKPFVVYTDASKLGIGVILEQEYSDTESHVIAYASRTLNKGEHNYDTTYLEALAVVYALKKFRPYLWGTTFKVITDHHPLGLASQQERNSAWHERLMGS